MRKFYIDREIYCSKIDKYHNMEEKHCDAIGVYHDVIGKYLIVILHHNVYSLHFHILPLQRSNLLLHQKIFLL